MSATGAISPLILTAVTAFAVTWITLRVAWRWQIQYEPVARSSHQRPTPTLGGLGIIAGTWAGYFSWLTHAGVPIDSYGLIAANLILLLFVVDDVRRPLTVREKLGLQIASALAVCASGALLGGISLSAVFLITLAGPWAWLATALWLVTLMNVYNFMDGIDGIGGVQTLTAGSWFAVCLWASGSAFWPGALIVVVATAAFMPFNFPPARIFMGDVGAMFLGLQFGVLSVLGAGAGLPIWVFAGVFGYYLFDVSYTLFRRALRGENLLAAHRLHLDQRFAQRGGWSHRRVDSVVALLNLILGAGVFLLSGLGDAFVETALPARPAGVVLVATAFAVLLAAVITVEAGDRREE